MLRGIKQINHSTYGTTLFYMYDNPRIMEISHIIQSEMKCSQEEAKRVARKIYNKTIEY